MDEKKTAKDCTELKTAKKTSGVYKIFPAKTEGVKVYCDMDTDNGGWTVSPFFKYVDTQF